MHQGALIAWKVLDELGALKVEFFFRKKGVENCERMMI